MTTKKPLVDLEFVKSLGVMQPHDVEAIALLYPDLFDKSAEAATARFAGRVVPEGKVDDVRRHVGALVAADLWAKVGTKSDADTQAVEDAKSAAEEWLKSSESLKAARASAAPPPASLEDLTDKKGRV